jgi:hypothetical protein
MLCKYCFHKNRYQSLPSIYSDYPESTNLASSNLIPVTRPQLNGNLPAHAVHDLVNRPRLPLVTRRVVGRDSALVEADALLHRLDVLGVVLVGVDLWVVVPDPARVLGLRQARVQLDLGPVGFLQQFGVGEAHLLGAGVADEAVAEDSC